MQLTVEEICVATKGELLWGEKNTKIIGVSTDSRENMENKLFVPLKGENFDGHDYINKAFENNALGCITHKDQTDFENKGFAIKVDDTKKALGDIAKYYLKKTNATVIGVTGSVGKTTTRQLVKSVISQLGKTASTIKNFNNDIGLPLSILAMDGDEKFVVLEMGMSDLGEISYLSKIAKPDIGIITMIGMSHIEKLKTRENILKAKLEILDGMSENGCLLLNGDDEMLVNARKDIKIKTELFGIKNGKYPIEVKECEEKCVFVCDGYEFTLNVGGVHNIQNASSAILAGKVLGATNEQIQKGLFEFENVALRQELKSVGEKKIILDCYNASLDSMRASLKLLKDTVSKRKVAILGAIGELGDYLEPILNEVGKSVFENDVDLLILCEENSCYIKNGALKAGMSEDKIRLYEKKADLKNEINSLLKDGDCVLIKASRAYKFEEIFEFIK